MYFYDIVIHTPNKNIDHTSMESRGDFTMHDARLLVCSRAEDYGDGTYQVICGDDKFTVNVNDKLVEGLEAHEQLHDD